MLDICRKEGSNIDIIFNAKKSNLFTVGKSYDKNIDNLYLGADEVLWSPRLTALWRYINFVLLLLLLSTWS